VVKIEYILVIVNTSLYYNASFIGTIQKNVFLGQMSRNSKISASRKSSEFWTDFGLTGDSVGRIQNKIKKQNLGHLGGGGLIKWVRYHNHIICSS